MSASPTAKARPGQKRRAVKRPARWEYRLAFLSGPPQSVANRAEESVELEALERSLNELGADGWELVGYGMSPLRAWSRQRDPRMIGVFKRLARVGE